MCIRDSSKAYQAYDGRTSYLFNSLSLRASLENIVNLGSRSFELGKEKAIMEFFAENGLNISIISIAIFIVLLTVCRTLPIEIKYMFGVYTIWASVPISFIYTTVLLIPIIGAMINKDFGHYISKTVVKNKGLLPPYILMLCALIITLLPISLPIQQLKFMLMNLLWMTAIISFIIQGISNLRIRNR